MVCTPSEISSITHYLFSILHDIFSLEKQRKVIMEFSNSFDGFWGHYGFPDIIKGGSSLVLDNERGEIVRALVKPAQKGVKAEKGLAALRNHSEAERRRRERINGHLASLRSLIPGTNKVIYC